MYNVSSAGYGAIDLFMDTFGGTIIGSAQFNPGGQSSTQSPAAIVCIVENLAPGTHTLRVGVKVSSGTIGIECSGSRPLFIIIEQI